MDVTSLPETISPITEPGTKLSRWALTRSSLQVRSVRKHAPGSLGTLLHIHSLIPIYQCQVLVIHRQYWSLHLHTC